MLEFSLLVEKLHFLKKQGIMKNTKIHYHFAIFTLQNINTLV